MSRLLRTYIITIVCLLPFSLHAQLNYTLSAYSEPFVAITNGTPVTLSNFNTSGSATDDGYMNNVPIGFTFNYNGKDYTTIHITTNGMAALGDTLRVTSNFNSATNSLVQGDGIAATHRAYLAPLWSDLDIISTSNLTYQLNGIAPSRIFTIEWNNIQWYGVSFSKVSFQIQLFETSNEIRYAYRQEASGSAGKTSVGITDTVTGPDHFIALQNVSSNPPVSTVFENLINQIPATGQVYKFSVVPCGFPNLKLEGFTNNKITFSNSAMGNEGFEYSVTTNINPPESGTTATQSTVNISSLSSATQYYFQCRNICNSGTKGPWKTAAFKTAVDPVKPPYIQNFNAATPQYTMPEEMRTIQRDSTKWHTASLAQYSGNSLSNSYSNGYNSYSWFYLPPLSLNKLYRYRLKFRYQFLFEQMLYVKYGKEMDSSTATGTSVATITDFSYYKDTSFLIQPSETGAYYIGFLASGRDTGIAVDDINFTEDSILLPVKFISLKGTRVNRQNVLKWLVADEFNIKEYVVQRSFDGNTITNIGIVNSKNSAGESEYNYTDKEALSGKSYYRILETDKDGKITYSSVAVINGEENKILSLFPNPVTDILNFSLEGLNDGSYSYTITDITGRVWTQSKTIFLSSFSSFFKINTDQLPAGTYILKLNSNSLKRALAAPFFVIR